MPTNLGAIIDALGALRAQMADLERQEKELKDTLVDLEPGAYEGDLFRLSISETERAKLDMDAVRKKLSDQFIRAHTSYSTVRTHRVSARNGK